MREINNIRIKICVFSIAFTLGLNLSGVAPILGVLDNVFKEKGANTVQALQTLPYFLLMIASIVVGWLVTRISKKRLVLGGLIFIAFIGTSPFIVDNFTFMMISRFLIGFGFGIIAPLNTAIISEFFQGKDRAALMGVHVTGMGIGAMCINIVGGMLGSIGYQKFFLLHLIAMISFLIVITQLPETGVQVSKDTKHSKVKLNRMVFDLSITSFFHTLFITAYMTNIGIHISQNLNGSSALTGVVTAFTDVFALIVGLTFSKISSLFKEKTLPFSIIIAGVGYLSLVVFSNNMIGIFFASACLGISLSCFMAQASYMISMSVSQIAVTLASGVFGLIGGIGGLLSPIILNCIAKSIFGNVSTGNIFIICTIGMLVLAMFSYILVICRTKNAVNKL
ncbi:MFS transporter [Clostridium gelidum]|uniref:MFS transporter n=1 Tax=Clostridium gelidum TaxID=704125 RepID=A0ABN6IVT2_9CLOT|nr:MFS transporter [Clostridium gelidum]BCZ44993.1 MFS transporter [Clostridium gelidum]